MQLKTTKEGFSARDAVRRKWIATVKRSTIAAVDHALTLTNTRTHTDDEDNVFGKDNVPTTKNSIDDYIRRQNILSTKPVQKICVKKSSHKGEKSLKMLNQTTGKMRY